jgi:hypothetical protein
VTVHYSKNGFRPAEVAIKKGDTVRFVATSGSAMWVVSDDASLTQKEAGLDYLFKSTKPGTYVYHNKHSATHRGMVTVEDTNAVRVFHVVITCLLVAVMFFVVRTRWDKIKRAISALSFRYAAS